MKRVCLGKIATAHGVKGFVKILCYADDPHMLDGELFTGQNGDETLRLTMKNSMGKYWLAEVQGVADRDAALALRGTQLWTNRENLPEVENEDEFYIEDLIGLRAEDTSGNELGKIITVQNYGAGDLLEISPPGKESYFVPFTKKNVPEVFIDEGRVVVVPL